MKESELDRRLRQLGEFPLMERDGAFADDVIAALRERAGTYPSAAPWVIAIPLALAVISSAVFGYAAALGHGHPDTGLNPPRSAVFGVPSLLEIR